MKVIAIWLALLLSSCGPVHCQKHAQVQRSRNPATGMWELAVRCDGDVILTRTCSDGGARRVNGEREALLCDGAEILTYPAAAVTVVTQ